MSYMYMRKFVEVMKTLGYPKAISMDSFRTPDFAMVADCLHWLVSRYDPSADLDTDISTEQKRVAFIKSATQLMLSKGRIKLNPRRLYSADGVAVKELLKIASVLEEATNLAGQKENEVLSPEQFPTRNAFEMKATRALVSEITKFGASLYDCLAEEPELHEARWMSRNLNTDMDEIEKSVENAISAVEENIASAKQDLEALRIDEKTLEAKYEKKKLELERAQKRLSTLENVRPAYMDEYEVLEKQLQGLFESYLEKHRNLQWLEGQMESLSSQEQEKADEAERKMRRLQRRAQNEELSILRGEEVPEDAVGNDGSSEEESELEGPNFWNWFRSGSSSPFRGGSSKSTFLSSTGSDVLSGLDGTRRSSKGSHTRRESLGGGIVVEANLLGRSDAIATDLSQRLEESEERLTRGINSIQASLDNSEGDSPQPPVEGDDSDLLDMEGADQVELQDSSSDDF